MLSSTSKPYLIIVTSRPAAGKTSIARRFAKELNLPLASKDSIREVLFNRLGWKDREWAQLLGRASIDLMFHFAEVQLEAGHSFILDNAFDPALSTPRFLALQKKFNVGIIQIICNSDAKTLFNRFVKRADSGERHPGHGDKEVLEELRAHLAEERSPVMELDGVVIEIDTTDFELIDHQAILQELKSLITE